jgi:hypothetical protein
VPLSSVTRTALALRTQRENEEKKGYILRNNRANGKHEVVEQFRGLEKVVFQSGDRVIAQRAFDRFEANV